MNKEVKFGNSRILGKSIKQYMMFFEEGVKGKSVIYATPQGNFLSPKAVEQALSTQLQSIKEEVEGLPAHSSIIARSGSTNRKMIWLDEVLQILTKQIYVWNRSISTKNK